MESICTKLALSGSKNEFARTDTVFLLISEVCNSTVSLTTIFNFSKTYLKKSRETPTLSTDADSRTDTNLKRLR